MKKLLEEFKAFALRGNVVDMAVGVVIGGAFAAITGSLVGDVITPLLAALFHSPNTDALNITLRAATEDSEAIVLGLGAFVGTIVNFLVIALVLFAVIKTMNRLKKKQEEAPAAPPEPSAEEKLLTEIRDLLKDKP